MNIAVRRQLSIISMMNIGIFPGTFDPVHDGHIAFANAAAQAVGLDAVYFMPDPVPRHKTPSASYQERVAMLQLVSTGRLHVYKVSYRVPFTVPVTWPLIKKKFPTASLNLLLGSDTFLTMDADSWPGLASLLQDSGLVIGVREGQKELLGRKIRVLEGSLKCQIRATFVETQHQHVSSTRLKKLRFKEHTPDSVSEYIARRGLYTKKH